MKNLNQAARQDGSNFLSQLKVNNNLLLNQEVIKKIYEIEFEEKFGMILVGIKIKERVRQSRKEILSLFKILKNTEYIGIFKKLINCIGINGDLSDTMFEKILEMLSKPFVKDDSISDFTLIEYMNGEKELVIQPEII